MAESAVSWDLQAAGAMLQCGPLQAFARCDGQGLDVVAVNWGGRPTPGISVLCSIGPLQSGGLLDVAERYVRGSDFIASCRPAGNQRITPQAYWRAAYHREMQAARIELMLSAQTDLLDSGPTWRVSSFVRDASLYHCLPGQAAECEDVTRAVRTFDASTSMEHLFVFRIPTLDITYAQMVHPTDFATADVVCDGTPLQTLNTTLFPDRLEKGVIRRGRICGWFLPGKDDLEKAVQLARDFVHEPLPLTA